MNKFLNIEIKDRRKARIYTGIIMSLFFLLLIFYPFFSYQNPPPGQEGLLVSFGDIEVGQGDDAPAKAETPKESKPKTSKKETKPESKPEPKREKTKVAKAEPKEIKSQVDEKVIAANNQEIALRKKRAAEKKLKEIADAKAKADQESKDKIAAAAAEKKKKKEQEKLIAAAAAEKKKKEEEERIAAAAAKASKDASDLKNALSNSFGKGKGDTGIPGEQGDPNGDPNADALKGISTGAGVIGGGLAGRGGSGPGITDNSNKTGTVVINVCIDSNGNVTSAVPTLKGSTTTDAELVKLATDNANQWSFNDGTTDTTCGTITYDFKVK